MMADRFDEVACWWDNLSPAKREIWRWALACSACFASGFLVGVGVAQ